MAGQKTAAVSTEPAALELLGGVWLTTFRTDEYLIQDYHVLLQPTIFFFLCALDDIEKLGVVYVYLFFLHFFST